MKPKTKELTLTEFMTFLTKNKCREQFINNIHARNYTLYKYWNDAIDAHLLCGNIIFLAFRWDMSTEGIRYWTEIDIKFVRFIDKGEYTIFLNPIV